MTLALTTISLLLTAANLTLTLLYVLPRLDHLHPRNEAK